MELCTLTESNMATTDNCPHNFLPYKQQFAVYSPQLLQQPADGAVVLLNGLGGVSDYGTL